MAVVSGPSEPLAPTTPAPTRWPGTFRALRHYNYRLWFAGQGVSLIGTWMQTMAEQMLVYRLTGSAAYLGYLSLAQLVPLLTLALVGGSIADRFPKRKVLLVTQVAMLIQALVLSALTLSGAARVWHVFVLAVLLGICAAVDTPTRQAFTVEMVEGKEDLTNAIALNSAIFNGARALGPAAAGLAVAATGEGMAFFLNALSFVAVIVGLLLMRNLPAPTPHRVTGLVTDVAEGARYVRHQQSILVLMSLVSVSAFLSMPYNVLMPVFAGQVLEGSARPVVSYLCDGPRALLHCQTPEALPLGMLLSMIGVGAVIGALAVASLPARARRGTMLTIGNLCFPLLLLAFASSRSFVVSLLVLALVGISFVWQNSLANTLIQLATPDELRGRVMSVYSLCFQGTMRLGGLQAGLVAARFGAPISVGVGAAVSLLYGLFIAMRYPRVRNMA